MYGRTSKGTIVRLSMKGTSVTKATKRTKRRNRMVHWRLIALARKGSQLKEVVDYAKPYLEPS